MAKRKQSVDPESAYRGMLSVMEQVGRQNSKPTMPLRWQFFSSSREEMLERLRRFLKDGDAYQSAKVAFLLGCLETTRHLEENGFFRARAETLRRLWGKAAKHGGTPEQRQAVALAEWDRLIKDEPLLIAKEREAKVKRSTGVAPRSLRRYIKQRSAS